MAVNRVDLATVRGRLIAALNAAAAGVWSTTIPAGADLRRNDTELDKAILAADSWVCRLRASTPGDGYRELFQTDSGPLNHGDRIPHHIGPIEQVRIRLTAGGVLIPGKHDETVTLGDIQRWRDDANGVYGEDAAANSQSGGFYVVQGNHIFFTGYEAVILLANITRTGACQAPETDEDLVLARAYILSPKEGDEGRFLGAFAAYANAGAEEIKGGAVIIQPLQMAQEATR
jgi:hypothetical protein